MPRQYIPYCLNIVERKQFGASYFCSAPQISIMSGKDGMTLRVLKNSQAYMRYTSTYIKIQYLKCLCKCFILQSKLSDCLQMFSWSHCAFRGNFVQSEEKKNICWHALLYPKSSLSWYSIKGEISKLMRVPYKYRLYCGVPAERGLRLSSRSRGF